MTGPEGATARGEDDAEELAVLAIGEDDRLAGIDAAVENLDDDAVEGIDPLRGDCLLLAIDDPDRLAGLLDRLADVPVPSVVAPREGSEQLATVALRGGATEYVPSGESLDDRLRRAAAAGTDGRFHEAIVTALPDEAFVIDEDGTYLEATIGPDAGDLRTVPADELVGTTIDEAFPPEDAAEFRACIEAVLESGERRTIEYDLETTAGSRQYEARVVPIDGAAHRRATLWLARDVTERAERERELRRRRDQLETFDGVNRVISRIIRTLVEAPTRADVERTVCDGLVESELYCGAWIGEPDGDGGLLVRARAGEARTLLDHVGSDAFEPAPVVGRVLEIDRVQTTTQLPTEPKAPAAIRRAAAADDVTAASIVPLIHDGTRYGVLVAYARREDAFSDRERSALRTLGETVGFAINATLNRRLLFADSVVELELRVAGGDSLSFHLTDRYDCRCRHEWIGEAGSGRTYQYVVVDGLDGETVDREARAHPSVADHRIVDDGPDRTTIEVRFRESGVERLTGHGATVRGVTVEDGVAEFRAEVPRDADVRSVVEALQSVYDDAVLVARREVDRPVRTARERRDRIAERLTDRQLTALRLAYYGGYFDWPRGSTGEEIAETMEVSAPTMHQHLRRALRELSAAFFEPEES